MVPSSTASASTPVSLWTTSAKAWIRPAAGSTRSRRASTVFDSPAHKRCLRLALSSTPRARDVQVTRQHRRPLGPLQPRRGRRHALVHGDRRSAVEPAKFDSNGVRETYAKMFLTLWNVYKFHADEKALDGYDAEASEPMVADRPALDRWVLSRLNTVAQAYHEGFVTWDYHKACRNWRISSSTTCPTARPSQPTPLVGRCPNRRQARLPAHPPRGATTVCRLVAPVAPFMVDVIHRNLTGEPVHQAAWPLASPAPSRAPPPTRGMRTLKPRPPTCRRRMPPRRTMALVGNSPKPAVASASTPTAASACRAVRAGSWPARTCLNSTTCSKRS